jgi:hypothetical protein
VTATLSDRVSLLQRLAGLAPAGDAGPAGALARAGGAGTEASARFDGGFELLSSRVDVAQARPGGTLGLALRWRLPQDAKRLDRVAVWVHAVDAGGRVVFQADHALLDDLRAPATSGDDQFCAASWPVPAEVPPGSYELRAGLWIPVREQRLHVRDAAAAHDRESVSLGTLAVAPR